MKNIIYFLSIWIFTCPCFGQSTTKAFVSATLVKVESISSTSCKMNFSKVTSSKINFENALVFEISGEPDVFFEILFPDTCILNRDEGSENLPIKLEVSGDKKLNAEGFGKFIIKAKPRNVFVPGYYQNKKEIQILLNYN